MSNLIEVQKNNGVLVVRFIRPETRNPLSVGVIDELDDLFSVMDSDVRAIVFTGTGDIFASGADLREIAEVTAEGAQTFALRGQHLMSGIDAMPQTTVAAINGYCFGGALDLALACDRRMASPNAMFAHPGTGLGIITGWGGTQRLPRLVGTANSLEMFFTATAIDAERAFAIGLVDEIAAEPLDAALRFVG
jgi:enoyl-CoA hydratase